MLNTSRRMHGPLSGQTTFALAALIMLNTGCSERDTGDNDEAKQGSKDGGQQATGAELRNADASTSSEKQTKEETDAAESLDESKPTSEVPVSELNETDVPVDLAGNSGVETASDGGLQPPDDPAQADLELDTIPALTLGETEIFNSSDSAIGGSGGGSALPLEGSGGASSTGSAGAAGAISTGGTSASAPITEARPIGAPCELDKDCLVELTCLLEDVDFFGGTIAKGLCTTRCEHDVALCSAISAGSGCVPGSAEPDAPAYCLQLCQVGDTAAQGAQCQANLNRMCIPVRSDGLGVCYPKCFDDRECEDTGGFCDLSTGACVATAPVGLPIGDSCEADTECAGQLCIDNENGTPGLCSATCALTGLAAGCGADAQSATIDAMCAPLLYADSQPLDPGLCIPTCDADADCSAEWACNLFDDQAASTAFGRNGTCLPVTTPQ